MDRPAPAEHLALATADGVTLEAQLAPAPESDGPPPAVAVVCHPHPLYGGSMHNNVVDRLFADLPANGIPTLRFNFRGVGRSTGSHGGGEAEVADVLAAVDELSARHPGAPVLLAGYSFGADVVLSVADGRLAGWLAISPPLRIVDPEMMAAGSDERPTVIVSGTADDFRPAERAEQVVASWSATEVVAAPGVDHFWTTGLDHLGDGVGTILDRITVAG